MDQRHLIKDSGFSVQVCVPKTDTGEEVLRFAESAQPCGTTNGWGIRRQGDEMLKGCEERVQCDLIPENCHIMLDA